MTTQTTRTKNSLNLTQITALLATVPGARIVAPHDATGCFVECVGYAWHLRMVDLKAMKALHARHALTLVESDRFKNVYGKGN